MIWGWAQGVPFSKVTEGLCLALEKGGNIIDGVAIQEIHSEWMLDQYVMSVFLS